MRSAAAAIPVLRLTVWVVWVLPGGHRAEPAAGPSFPVEAALSRFEAGGDPFYTVILRDVDERLEAERTIRSLTATNEYLREEIAEEHGVGGIVGRSPVARTALKAVAQVAATSASVLLLGETGTRKEVFARAIHERSPRRGRPLVRSTARRSRRPSSRASSSGTSRCVHRCDAAAGRPVRARRRRGHLPRRDRRAAARAGGQAPPCTAGGRVRAHRRLPHPQGRRARHRCHEPGPRAGRARRGVPRRPVLLAERLPAPAPTAARARRRRRPPRGCNRGEARAEPRAIDPAARAFGRGGPEVVSLAWQRARAAQRPGARDHHVGRRPTPPRSSAVARRYHRPASAARTGAGWRHPERAPAAGNMLAALASAGWRGGVAAGAAQMLGVSPSTFKSRMKSLGIQGVHWTQAGRRH